jgi:serine/threonine protein kinase
MADVFLARDTARGGRLVALKRLRVGDQDTRTHFTREARIGALLSHPNVVRVEDAGEDEEGLFIALEFVDGVSASRLLRFFAHQRAALPLELWFVLARDIAAGLHYAHTVRLKGITAGVLHRDLSPDNVLVSLEGVARLSDFGLAYVEGDTRLTRTGTVKGKVAYLAPELFESAAPSIATDVYAMGVMLFRLASGVAPFRGSNDGELILNILRGERPMLSALRPDLPGPIAAWVQQSIGQRAAERPPLSALLELLPEVPANAPPRAALAQAVEEAQRAGKALERTLPPQPPPREPQEARTEPMMAVQPVEPTELVQAVQPVAHEPPRLKDAVTVPARRPLPAAPSLDEVPTTPARRAMLTPSAGGDDTTDRVQPVVPQPTTVPDLTPLKVPGPLERPWKRMKRPPAWLVAIISGLLAGALAVGAWALLAS